MTNEAQSSNDKIQFVPVVLLGVGINLHLLTFSLWHLDLAPRACPRPFTVYHLPDAMGAPYALTTILPPVEEAEHLLFPGAPNPGVEN